MNNDSLKVGAVILAAGSSVRLGRPKQLLQYKGKSLLQHQLQAAGDSNVEATVVVLNATGEQLIKEVTQRNAHFAINQHSAEGMASSIACGLSTLINILPDVDAVIILVSDQPFVTGILLNNLIEAHLKTKRAIVTCSYNNTFGPPTLFHKSMFAELLKLTGDTGARKVVQQHVADVETLVFEKGGIDIDTEEDYKNLLVRKD